LDQAKYSRNEGRLTARSGRQAIDVLVRSFKGEASSQLRICTKTIHIAQRG
jgi:hypothetical protein